ncbi:MAG TPA: hypothetical protein VJ824_04925 [Bacillota bacterium]|nr:hypothetical protein [Bacillota bacterium]
MIFKEKFSRWIQTNYLIQIRQIDQRVIIGRLIEYNEENRIILVYHEDEKQVYSIKLGEIYEIKPT